MDYRTGVVLLLCMVFTILAMFINSGLKESLEKVKASNFDLLHENEKLKTDIQNLIYEYEQENKTLEKALNLTCERLSREVCINEQGHKDSAEDWKIRALRNVQ